MNDLSLKKRQCKFQKSWLKYPRHLLWMRPHLVAVYTAQWALCKSYFSIANGCVYDVTRHARGVFRFPKKETTEISKTHEYKEMKDRDI